MIVKLKGQEAMKIHRPNNVYAFITGEPKLTKVKHTVSQ